VYVSNPVLLGVIVMLSIHRPGCFTLFMATIPAETVRAAPLAPPSGW